jgi:hypothetical protein
MMVGRIAKVTALALTEIGGLIEPGSGAARAERPMRQGTLVHGAGLELGDGLDTQQDPGRRGGLQHSCATRTNGTLWCWGNNDHGELGTGTTTSHDTPQQVPS